MPAVQLVRTLLSAVTLALALTASAASAKAWQGITPGVSTQAEVIKRFGEPSTQGKIGTRAALVYREEQAISGTRQAQFFTRADGMIDEITVFPAAQLDRDSVEGTYGKGAQKSFTDDFKPVWIYRSLGVMVFFGKDGYVEAIRFQAPQTSKQAPASTGDAPAEHDSRR